MSEEICIPLSDEYSDEDEDSVALPTKMQGTLSKWTNYIHGWQNRYFVLQEGKLSYYKNQNEASIGCRGSLSVYRAVVKCHGIDECRFDVCINDSVWYLRTTTLEEREQWVEALEKQKMCNGFRTFGSNVSLTPSVNSSSSVNLKRVRSNEIETNLKEKLTEIETYRDIIIKQMETLQSFFDVATTRTSQSCSNLVHETGLDVASSPMTKTGSPIPPPSPLIGMGKADSLSSIGLDLRGEALTFKATTAAILTSLNECVDVIHQREDVMKKKLDRETERRKKLEEKMKEFVVKATDEPQTKYVVMGGPDYAEGPHSVIGEDEFYDAVESALDKLEEEDEFRERLRQKQRMTPRQPVTKHPLWPTIEKWTKQQLEYAREAVVGGAWQLFNEDGEMKLYRRELEEDGLVMDPLKAVHQVRGVTAHEMTHHFWSPDVRFDWDTTIEQMTVLDTISEDTLVFLQIHKRVWPTAQRDALFWSHIRQTPPSPEESSGSGEGGNPPIHDTWIVCNRSTEHADAPNEGNCVRVDLLVCMVCETYIDRVSQPNEELTREDLLCRITYCSVVNPGGWAPASVLRTVYKREYPRFLKRFTQYVINKCQGQPIAFSGLKIVNHSKHWRG